MDKEMITLEGLLHLGFKRSEFDLKDDGQGRYISEWRSASPQPTESEVETAHAEWEAEHAATQYQRDRATAYASIADQLDMQYWDSVNGTTTWADHIAAVKAAHPKP
jgi:hypothetical protein